MAYDGYSEYSILHSFAEWRAFAYRLLADIKSQCRALNLTR